MNRSLYLEVGKEARKEGTRRKKNPLGEIRRDGLIYREQGKTLERKRYRQGRETVLIFF